MEFVRNADKYLYQTEIRIVVNDFNDLVNGLRRDIPRLLTTNHFIIIFYVLPLLSPCGADQMQR